jgi:hypothetical protein
VVEAAIHFGNGSNFGFLDPIQWLRANDCSMMKDGGSLFRDAGHLSVAGTLALEANLSSELNLANFDAPGKNHD